MNIVAQEPMLSRVPSVVGIAVALVWAHYLPSLWPVPPRSGLPVDVQWPLWWESLFLMSLGFGAAFLAFRSVRFCWIAVLLTSGAVLAINLPVMIEDIAREPTFYGWLSEMHEILDPADLYFMLVIPLYHLTIVSFVFFYGLGKIVMHVRADANAA